MSGEEEDQEAQLTAELIEDGADVVGAAIGSAVGTLGGPVGIAAGALGGVAVARVIKRLGAEVHERLLGPRQRARAGLALGTAVERIHERSERGEVPREDGFFEYGPHGERPEGAELLEGVLLRAMNAYQERKVPYMGAFFASVAYRSDISPAYAHLMLRIADQLTYRQLVALAYFAENEGAQALLDLSVQRDEEGQWIFADGLGRELAELGGDLGLLGIRQDDGRVVRADRTWGGADFEGQALGAVAPTDLGRDLYDLMALASIPEEDKRGILDLMERVTWRTQDSGS